MRRKRSGHVGTRSKKLGTWVPKRTAKKSLNGNLSISLRRRWIRGRNSAAVLRSIGAVVEGNHPIMNGEAQRIPATNDKRGELTIFYVAHEDGVSNGYAENNRTKEVVRWKATGQHLSPEA